MDNFTNQNNPFNFIHSNPENNNFDFQNPEIPNDSSFNQNNPQYIQNFQDPAPLAQQPNNTWMDFIENTSTDSNDINNLLGLELETEKLLDFDFSKVLEELRFEGVDSNINIDNNDLSALFNSTYNNLTTNYDLNSSINNQNPFQSINNNTIPNSNALNSNSTIENNTDLNNLIPNSSNSNPKRNDELSNQNLSFPQIPENEFPGSKTTQPEFDGMDFINNFFYKPLDFTPNNSFLPPKTTPSSSASSPSPFPNQNIENHKLTEKFDKTSTKQETPSLEESILDFTQTTNPIQDIDTSNYNPENSNSEILDKPKIKKVNSTREDKSAFKKSKKEVIKSSSLPPTKAPSTKVDSFDPSTSLLATKKRKNTQSRTQPKSKNISDTISKNSLKLLQKPSNETIPGKKSFQDHIGDIFSVGTKSLDSVSTLFEFLRKGITPVTISWSSKNILALSWPEKTQTPSNSVSQINHNEFTAIDGFLSGIHVSGSDKSNINYSHLEHLNNKRSTVYLFKTINSDSCGHDTRDSSRFNTQRLIPLGQLVTGPTESGDISNSHLQTPSTNITLTEKISNDNSELNTAAQIWWCPDGERLAISNSIGEISIYQIHNTISKWKLVTSTNMNDPISSFLWIENKRKYIAEIKYIGNTTLSSQSEDLHEKDIKINIFRESGPNPLFHNFFNSFFTLSRSGKLQFSNINKKSENASINLQPPPDPSRVNGVWSITHSDMVKIDSSCLQHPGSASEIAQQFESELMTGPSLLLAIVVYWRFVSSSQLKAELGSSSVQIYVVRTTFDQNLSLSIIAYGDLKLDPSPFSVTALKLVPTIYHYEKNTSSSLEDPVIPTFPRIVVAQSKPINSIPPEEKTLNPQFESIVHGFDVIIEKNTKTESQKLYKLRPLRVLHYKNFLSKTPNPTELSLPVSINHVAPMCTFDQRLLHSLNFKDTKNLYHYTWVVCWSNGCVTRHSTPLGNKGLNLECEIVLPPTKSSNTYGQGWTCAGNLINDATNYFCVRVDTSSFTKDRLIFNIGNMEMLDLPMTNIVDLVVGAQVYVPGPGESSIRIRNQTLEFSFSTLLAYMIALRILNGQDTTDVVSIIFKAQHYKNATFDIEDLLTETLVILCTALNKKHMMLSPYDSTSPMFTTFLGIAMKIQSLGDSNSPLSLSFSLLVHLAGVSSSYATALVLSKKLFSDIHLPSETNEFGSMYDEMNIISGNPFGLTQKPNFSIKDEKSLTDDFLDLLAFDEWFEQLPVYYLQGVWALKVIMYYIRELLLWYQIHQQQQMNSNNLNPIPGYSIGRRNNEEIAKSHWLTLLLHPQALITICNSLALVKLLSNDIANSIQILTRLKDTTPPEDLPEKASNSLLYLEKLSENFTKATGSIPISMESLCNFLFNILCIVNSSESGYHEFGPAESSRMLITGVVDQNMVPLVSKVSYFYSVDILDIKPQSIHFPLPSSNSLSFLPKNNNTFLIIIYKTDSTRVLDCAEVPLKTFSVSRLKLDSNLTLKGSSGDRNHALSDSGISNESVLWVYSHSNFPPSSNNTKNTQKRKTSLSATQLPETSGSIDEYYERFANNDDTKSLTSFILSKPPTPYTENNPGFEDPSRINLANNRLKIEMDALKSNFNIESPRFFPIVTERVSSGVVIDNILKRYIDLPLPSVYNNLAKNEYNSTTSHSGYNTSLKKSGAVSESVLKLCSLCGQFSLQNASVLVSALQENYFEPLSSSDSIKNDTSSTNITDAHLVTNVSCGNEINSVGDMNSSGMKGFTGISNYSSVKQPGGFDDQGQQFGTEIDAIYGGTLSNNNQFSLQDVKFGTEYVASNTKPPLILGMEAKPLFEMTFDLSFNPATKPTISSIRSLEKGEFCGQNKLSFVEKNYIWAQQFDRSCVCGGYWINI
ncbi:hypothetical protein BB559_004812 [Furculomyces boomerangus]|uniref:Mediator complex subunit 16 n=2 Tax=Harpellales TaxID=61421 RepID=A0A2T9YCI0_9FUNG|nr:hypothetical protein BB559_004812 [Furculomyces boomerangus]PVZ99094.1 hypothetical protein BB558_004895 [Smittium angustum]